MASKSYDVVVVGAGPVGLFLACELRLAGLTVMVVEKRTGREGMAENRAFVMHGRSLEMLAARGLLEQFLESGQKSNWWHYGVLDTRLDYSVFGPETDQNYVLLVPQYRTEMIFLRRAEELGVVIVKGVRVQSIETTDHSVTVGGTHTTQQAENQFFTATGKYLVGADGVRSTIRELADIGFPGSPPVNTVMSGEATLGVPMANPYLVHNEHGLLIAADLHVPSGRARLNIFARSKATVPESVPVTLEEMNEAIRQVTRVDYKLSNPCMLKRFSNEQRLATRYQSGRIFIVGDACHKHLPAGGQGLNVGLQEALNLGWKLGEVIRGSAPSSLLHTYEDERLPVAKAVVENTTSQSLLFFASTGPEWAVRAAMDRLLRLPEANKSLGLEISGFAVSYPKPLDMVCPDGWDPLPKGMQGMRALHVKIQSPDGEVTNLFEYMRHAHWIQLQLPGKKRSQNVSPAFGDRTVLVEAIDMPDLEERVAFYSGGLREILVRPDGYLAFGRPDQYEEIRTG
ncbi:FAD binding domain-containing protein [Aspergillus alliaceus]|uniref:FAD binding domain-containing protein n=1 Tax=Petromyces alliaceus TaxID=209559 RepID=A0A5N7CIX3_PETAA|nr:FAD binding domain-containing protein [Aspergillus alliaceus]